jgi:TRAP-type mannitol/chloroaromatic compound transport system substrate-binding protein
MKKIFSGILILALLTISAPGMYITAVEAQNVTTWRLPAHYPAASVSFKDSVQVVAQVVKERSNGRLILEPYAAGALIPGPEVFNAVKRGMVPIGITSSAYDLAQVPLFNVVAGLPFNFANEWEGVYFHQWLGFEKMVQDELLKNHGVLFFSDKIYTTELSLKKPVRTIEDFKGLKLRSSGILQKYLTSIGAAATMIPGGDIYAGLASGMLDGAHWGAVQGSSSMKFYEVSKYHLRPALNVAATDIWVINKKAFDRLPEDLQQILVSTLEEHFWRRTNQYIYQEALELAKIQKEQNVTLLNMAPEEFAKLQAAALKIWDEVAAMSPECAKAVEMLKEFNRGMGRLQ